MKKASPYIKRIVNYDQILNDLNNNYYTSIETDEHILSALDDLSLVYAPIEVREDLLSAINDLSGVYTPLSSFNNLQNDVLTGYFTKTEIREEVLSSYMNSTEVLQAIQTSNHLKKEIVSSLPQIQNALENTIYMVLNSTNFNSNIYDEYMLINNNWERIGNTAIDITNYANLNNENTFLDDQIVSGDLTVTNNLNISSTIIAQSGYFIQDLKIAQRSINNYLTNVDILYNIYDAGYDIETITLTTFLPKNERIYKHILSNNDILTFTTTSLTNTKMISFELHLIQPSTPVSFTFSNQIKWIHDLNFNSLNLAPDFSEGNKEYAIIIRWDGEDFLGNLIYTKDIENE